MAYRSVPTKFLLMVLVVIALMSLSGTDARAELSIVNGWFVHNGKALWGYAQHNGWWRKGQRPNLTRNAGSEIGPNRTEDLELLTDNMLRWGYPGFEHNFGLWYDRRRDTHDTAKRSDDKVVGPFLEMPWQRSNQGSAWDGLPQYDLTRFNPWYFDRLTEFARLGDRKGTLLLHNFYMQHALLEINSHYVDFPWREVNCIQQTGMPDTIPAASAFYDTTNIALMELHRLYIRHCLDKLGGYDNVIHFLSEEYTGPSSFVRFWAGTVTDWEKENGRSVKLALSATMDVTEEILADPGLRDRFEVIDLRYWWYRQDGSLVAPPGGENVPGRYRGLIHSTSPEKIYSQVRRYRDLYPGKALIHEYEASRQGTWAFLMAGGSILIRRLEYIGASDPYRYIQPSGSGTVKPLYDFINTHLAVELHSMKPLDIVSGDSLSVWCIGEFDKNYLCYAMQGGIFTVDLRGTNENYTASWVSPRNGDFLQLRPDDTIEAGKICSVNTPDERDWALWIRKAD